MEGAGVGDKYAPANPSQLRESHRPPSSQGSTSREHGDFGGQVDGADEHGGSRNSEEQDVTDTDWQNRSSLPQRRRLTQQNWDQASGHGSDTYEHGYISPQMPGTPRGYYSSPSTPAFGRPYSGDLDGTDSETDNADSFFGNTIANGLLGNNAKSSTTQKLAQKHGVKRTSFMYFEYYVPFVKWSRQYNWSFLTGDLIAALTMASFYIPMSLSYASNLAHIPAINGLYAFAINPLIYALMGTCPQMVVGPEAAGSLLTGNVVRDEINRGGARDDDSLVVAQIAGVVTGVAGAILLAAGSARLGFLDNVLSRPFLRGFISAIGIVILVDQLIPELGLTRVATEVGGVAHGSCLAKAIFLVKYGHKAHGLTSAVSFGSFAIIMICREIKKRLQPRYPKAAYVPDRFAIVVISTILCWQLRWDQKGLTILGDVSSSTGRPFPVHFPFNFSHFKHVDAALSTAFVIALLGFFESSVAAKSLGTGPTNGIKNMTLSANRELMALGFANIIGGVFMSLPAFGGYGRSKVNSSTGGKTPMSSVFLSLITFFCIYVVLPWFYYIPKGVLSAMISVVAYSLIEEAPHDLHFFWTIRGWSELFLIFIVFAATVFWSLSVGIACGIGFSLLRVIRHATRPRIQILGRVRGTTDQFESAEADPESIEFFEGCLIVKIPEPLTFANTGDLRNRLERLMKHGTVGAHPALPNIRRATNNRNIIFDVHGVTGLDGAGAQVLSEILQNYKSRGTRIFFCRCPNPRSRVYKLFVSSGIVDICGGPQHFVGSVGAALRMAELDDANEHYTDEPVNAV